MKVLLLGHNGNLGSYLADKLSPDILYSRIVYPNNVKYDYVINCIGRTDLDYCEAHKEETDYSNRDVVKDIQKYYPGSKIINFSSYFVYDSYGLCSEDSTVTYRYNYTRQHLEKEQLVNNGVSFRLGKLFGHRDKQHKLTEYIIHNDNLILDDITFNPASLSQVYRIVLHELNTGELHGIYNAANNNLTTSFEYGVFIDKIMGAGKKITRVKEIKRSYHNNGRFAMSLDKISKHVNLTDWHEDMITYLNSI
jgi:dTDP-4-dehydrorhamnose reductase